MKFSDLNIEKSVLDSIADMGYTETTEIQEKTIPLIKQGFDVVGHSKTGSGKTAAFGIPIVERTEKKGICQALVMAPTRELAEQIAGEMKKFSKHKKLEVVCVYGGVSIEPQIIRIRHADIIVGTPGRLLDHLRRGTLNLQHVKIAVLDEADRMLDMGFIDDITTIMSRVPKERQTLLFCATLPQEILRLKDRFTRNAKHVKTQAHVEEEFLKNYYYDVDHNEKFSLFVHLLKKENPEKAIIFCNTRHEADAVSRNLQENRINAICLHGGMTQDRRSKVMDDFHKGRIQLLIATDVAGRGLDISGVTHIFNYNVPSKSDDFVNRIGRTARAGKKGKSITLLDRNEHPNFARILQRHHLNIDKLALPHFEKIYFRRHEQRRTFGSGYGGRGRSGSGGFHGRRSGGFHRGSDHSRSGRRESGGHGYNRSRARRY